VAVRGATARVESSEVFGLVWLSPTAGVESSEVVLYQPGVERQQLLGRQNFQTCKIHPRHSVGLVVRGTTIRLHSYMRLLKGTLPPKKKIFIIGSIVMKFAHICKIENKMG